MIKMIRKKQPTLRRRKKENAVFEKGKFGDPLVVESKVVWVQVRKRKKK